VNKRVNPSLKFRFILRRELTALACIVFGYMLIVLFLSQLNPIATIMWLMITFFVPFMSKKEFLSISVFYSAAMTGMMFVRRDALTPLFGVDLFTLLGAGAIVVLALILHLQPIVLLEALHPAIIQSAGIILFFLSATSGFIIGSIEILVLLRILKIHRKVGMVPERWYLWRRKN